MLQVRAIHTAKPPTPITPPKFKAAIAVKRPTFCCGATHCKYYQEFMPFVILLQLLYEFIQASYGALC